MLANIYFWRDKTGHEIDCVIEAGQNLIPIEIKSSQTITDDFPSNLDYWRKLAGQEKSDRYVIYAGAASQKRLWGNVIGWKDISKLSHV